MASQTDLRRRMRFRSVLSLSPMHGFSVHDFEVASRLRRRVEISRWRITTGRRIEHVERKFATLARARARSRSRLPVFPIYSRAMDISFAEAMRKIRRANRAERGVEARFNWTNFVDISDFKCQPN